MKNNRTNKIAVWDDLETDEERIVFLKTGRAWVTGVIAKSLVPDVVELLEFRVANQK